MKITKSGEKWRPGSRNLTLKRPPEADLQASALDTCSQNLSYIEFVQIFLAVMTANISIHPVIYFDGECTLCNRFVQYVLKHDKKGIFRFASLQSDYARNRGFTIPVNSDGSLETMLVEWDGKVLQYSTGILLVLENLRGLNKLTIVFKIIPVALRDRLYRWIARHRYFFFGRTESCIVPTEDVAGRFLGVRE